MEHMVGESSLFYPRDNYRLLKIWLMVSLRAAQSQLLTNWSGVLFLLGKILRFFFFFIFLFRVMSSLGSLAGFTRNQVMVFFLVFNLVDVISQFLFRGVYQFRFKVVSGEYDLHLLKPLPSFFQPIFGWTDVLDFITVIPLLFYFIFFVISAGEVANLIHVILFILLLINSLILSFSFHLFVCAVGILTLEVDHLVQVYRDLTNMARFPTDIYQKGIQLVLTFTIPVIILITVPAKALMGLLSWQWVIGSFIIGAVFLLGSLKFWRYSLKKYSSASS